MLKVEYYNTKLGIMPEMSAPLFVGQQAPNFSLRNAEGQTVALSDYTGQNVIVYFYPKASAPGCTTEACDFRDNLNSLRSAGYAVLGISPDEPEALASFASDESLNFPLLSDPDIEVAKAYGSYGEKAFGEKTIVGTLRSTAVIDGEGKIPQIEFGVGAKGHVTRLCETLGA